MPEIRFSRRLASPNDIVGHDQQLIAAFRQANHLRLNDKVLPGNAYTTHYACPATQSILRQINARPREERLSLANTAEVMGEGVHQFAAFFERNLARDEVNHANGLVGASSAAIHTRLNGFQKALKAYQEAVLGLNGLMKSASPGMGQRRQQAETRVRTTYNALKESYRTELDRFASEAYRSKNRGDALSNAERAITLARRSPHAAPDPRLNVADTIQAKRVGAFAKHINSLGKTVVVVDAGIRLNKVLTSYQNDMNWMRQGALQMTGFGTAGAVGGLTGKYTVIGGTAFAAKAGLVATGPVGWAVLGLVVVAGIGAGFTAGYYADKAGQSFASWLWD